MSIDSSIDNDCQGCTPETGRHPGCHAKCEKYLKFVEKNKEIKKKENEYRDRLKFQRII
jgi:hypothetical protein